MARKNNPTFTKFASDFVPGYYSRTLFVFSPSGSGYLVSSSWVDTANYNGLNDLTSSLSLNCHGNYTLPAYYWRDGKTIRVSGYVSYDNTFGAGTEQFDMRFGLQEMSSSGVTWLSYQNNNTAHYVSAGGGEIPVTFDVVISCGTAASGSATESVFISKGYYEYDRENGVDVHYVPVYIRSNVGETLGSAYYVNPTSIAMNFYGSNPNEGNNNTSIRVYHILIEELA